MTNPARLHLDPHFSRRRLRYFPLHQLKLAPRLPHLCHQVLRHLTLSFAVSFWFWLLDALAPDLVRNPLLLFPPCSSSFLAPTSRAVPSANSNLTPEGAMLDTRRQVLKSALIVFDIGSKTRLCPRRPSTPISLPQRTYYQLPSGHRRRQPFETPTQKPSTNKTKRKFALTSTKRVQRVSDLKQERSVTHTNAVLSPDFLKRAHEVEKPRQTR